MDMLERDAQAVRGALVLACDGLIDREMIAEVVVLCAVAGEHLLVIGAPGTAKSEAVRRARPFQDHDVNPRMVKGRSMLRLAHRVASVVSWRPARCRAPTARVLRVAMARGPGRGRTWGWASRERGSRGFSGGGNPGTRRVFLVSS